MKQLTPDKPSALGSGWQARVSLLGAGQSSRVVQKIYGSQNEWNQYEATDAMRAERLFRGWLIANRVGTAVTYRASVDHDRHRQRFLMCIIQRYYGPNLEQQLLGFFRSGKFGHCVTMLARLLDIAVRLALMPQGGALRVEVKPRDFCGRDWRQPTMVDTFPPLLTSTGGRLMAAYRSESQRVRTLGEREESLVVTGSSLGILRNLCEHFLAAAPLSELYMEEIYKRVSQVNPPLASRLVEELISEKSRTKVSTLQARIKA